MANIGYATLSVVPSLSGFGPRLRAGLSGPLATEGSAAGDATGKSFASSFAKVALAGAAAAGVISIGKGFVDAAIESQKVSKQTEAVLKSMGNQAGLSADDISKLSTKLSLQSGIDDELIQSSSNVLLTFGKVRDEVGKGNDIFTRASQSALDMSVALGTDLQGATLQIGKALNDPIKGMTALTRAGVSFTAQQKEQVKAMVASGDTLGAQKLIVAELEKQFGGSAAAQATAGARLKVAFGNLQEQIGGVLLPVVEKVAGFLAVKIPQAVEGFRKVVDFVKRNKEPFIALATVVGTVLVTAFIRWGVQSTIAGAKAVASFVAVNAKAIASGVIHAVQFAKIIAGYILMGVQATLAGARMAAAWLVGLGPIGLVIAAVALAAVLIVKNWDTITDAAKAAFNWVKDNWPLILAIITGPIGLAVLAVVRNWDTIKEGFTAVKDWIGDRIGDIVGFFTGLGGRIAGVVGNLWGWLGDGLEAILNGIIAGFEGAVNFMIDGINAVIEAADVLAGPFINFGEVDNVDFGRLGEHSGSGIPKPTFGRFARAEGGPVWAGMGFLVGEQGPEVFVPGQDGTIIPNHALTPAVAAARGEGDLHVHVTQLPGEDPIDAAWRKKRWHEFLKTEVAAR